MDAWCNIICNRNTTFVHPRVPKKLKGLEIWKFWTKNLLLAFTGSCLHSLLQSSMEVMDWLYLWLLICDFCFISFHRTNPLGMKGHIARRYGDLTQDLWSGSSRSLAPLKLRVSWNNDIMLPLPKYLRGECNFILKVLFKFHIFWLRLQQMISFSLY